MTGQDPQGAAPLSLALLAPTLAPTPTPTPRPTPSEADELDTAPDEASEADSGSGSSTPRGGEATTGDATVPASGSSAASAGTSSATGAPNATPTTPAPATPTPEQPAESQDAPTAVPPGIALSDDVVVGNVSGVGPYRWGDSTEEIVDYVAQRLGYGPSIVEATDSTTGHRQFTWPGFMIDADPSGGLVQWYWYPSFSDGVVIEELGAYQSGLRFERRPSGTTVQTIGLEPNLWWVGSNLAVRYAWDAVATPPEAASGVIGAVIYVTASKDAPLTSGEPTVIPSGTEVLLSPNGARFYTVAEQTPMVRYRVETHNDEAWALVVPNGDDKIAGYVKWPPAGP